MSIHESLGLRFTGETSMVVQTIIDTPRYEIDVSIQEETGEVMIS